MKVFIGLVDHSRGIIQVYRYFSLRLCGDSSLFRTRIQLVSATGGLISENS
jgi:hypothetical protein